MGLRLAGAAFRAYSCFSSIVGKCFLAGVFGLHLAVARSKVLRTSLGVMARSSWKVLSVVAALVALYNFCNSLSFVPGPLRKQLPVAAASAAGMMMAPAAFADEIGDAAKKLGDASYDFAKEVDWNNGIFLQAPGKFQPLQALKAIDKMIDMGSSRRPQALEGSGGGPSQGHRKHLGPQRCDFSSGLGCGERSSGPRCGVRPQGKGHGRLQCREGHH